MFSSKTKIVGGIALIALVVSATVLGGLYYFLLKKETAFYDQVRFRAEGYATDRQLSALVNLVNDTEAERNELMQYILPSDAVISFLSLIETLGFEQGLVTETKSIAVEEGSTDNFETLSLVIEVRGSYARVVHMLQLIEALPYQVHVREVSVERSGADGWVGSFSLEVTKVASS